MSRACSIERHAGSRALHAMSRTPFGCSDDRMRELPQRGASNRADRTPGVHELSRTSRGKDAENVFLVSRQRSEDRARHAGYRVSELPPPPRPERPRRASRSRRVTRVHVVSQGRHAAGPARRDQASVVHDMSFRTRNASHDGSAGVSQLSQGPNRTLSERYDVLELSLVHAAALAPLTRRQTSRSRRREARGT